MDQGTIATLKTYFVGEIMSEMGQEIDKDETTDVRKSWDAK